MHCIQLNSFSNFRIENMFIQSKYAPFICFWPKISLKQSTYHLNAPDHKVSFQINALFNQNMLHATDLKPIRILSTENKSYSIEPRSESNIYKMWSIESLSEERNDLWFLGWAKFDMKRMIIERIIERVPLCLFSSLQCFQVRGKAIQSPLHGESVQIRRSCVSTYNAWNKWISARILSE
jgi:hypothetical protein